jgi:uroporphyrin-III C-methyltransferase / precorrin-2 dehydrogenase / sirohydrochlorin ferrochelatase
VPGEPELLPIFLKLADRPVLVVGAGPVAASKLGALMATGARLTVVAPEISAGVREAGVRIQERPFQPSDLDGVWLVVAAATPAVNREVARLAEAKCLFVNAVDDPPNATAYLGGVLRRDGLTVAISTSGRAPALAGLIREGLDALLPDDLDRWFARADELKREWRSTGVPMEARRPQLMEALVRLYEDRQAALAAAERNPAVSARQVSVGRPPVCPGFASLVGAGPGDPELLTYRAIRRLGDADLVLYDGLVPEAVVRLATRAEHVSVARRAGEKSLTQEAVSALIVDGAWSGKRVVRLKAGDPFVLGRGGEEVLALAEARVPFEIVPGVSSAVAAPALAGIPVTPPCFARCHPTR